LPSNPGIPITGAAGNIAAEVLMVHWLGDPVWIEYHPKETTVVGVESFELVVFSDSKVREVVRQAVSKVEIGQPSWKPLDRRSRKSLWVIPSTRDSGLKNGRTGSSALAEWPILLQQVRISEYLIAEAGIPRSFGP
jgi:hypothetical protein